jgi:hypothetical protein
MTRKVAGWNVALLLVLCFAEAFAIWAVRAGTTDIAYLNGPFVFLTGVSLFVIPGLFPLLWLAFRRFRIAAGHGPIVLWWVLAIGIFIIHLIAASQEAGLSDGG